MIDLPLRDDGSHRTIKFKGVFDFDGFYKYMIKWIKNHDCDFYERKIWDYPPYKIWHLEGRKKLNYAVLFYIKPEIWLWDAKPVEVIRNGKVKHLTEARMKVVLDAGFTWDYDGDFEKAGLKEMEAFLFLKIMYHDMVLAWFDYIDYYIFDFMTDLKKYLEMETASNAY